MESGKKGGRGSKKSGGATASPVGEQVEELTHQVQDQAGHLTEQVRSQVESNLMAQKERAASGLETVSLVLRQTGEQIRQQDQDTVARYVEDAADRVEQFSDQLRNQDLTQLVQETERFARRQPLLFAGGALTLGFLAVRFLRSSQPEQNSSGNYPMTTGAPYGGDVYGSGYAGTMSGSSYGYGSGAGIGSTTGYGTGSGMGSTSNFGGGTAGTASTSGLGDTTGHSSFGTGSGALTDELAVGIDVEGTTNEATTSGRSASPVDDRLGREKL